MDGGRGAGPACVVKEPEIPYPNAIMNTPHPPDAAAIQDKPEGQEPPQRPDEGMMFNRMLKSRTIMVSGEINKQLAERVIRSLILLEE